MAEAAQWASIHISSSLLTQVRPSFMPTTTTVHRMYASQVAEQEGELAQAKEALSAARARAKEMAAKHKELLAQEAGLRKQREQKLKVGVWFGDGGVCVWVLRSIYVLLTPRGWMPTRNRRWRRR